MNGSAEEWGTAGGERAVLRHRAVRRSARPPTRARLEAVGGVRRRDISIEGTES